MLKNVSFHQIINHDQAAESKLKKLGIFNLLQAEKIGLTQQDLSRLVTIKKIKRVSRGIYLHPEADLEGDVGFQIACAKFGSDAAIGGLSALFHYNLAEQVPGAHLGYGSDGKKNSRKGIQANSH